MYVCIYYVRPLIQLLTGSLINFPISFRNKSREISANIRFGQSRTVFSLDISGGNCGKMLSRVRNVDRYLFITGFAHARPMLAWSGSIIAEKTVDNYSWKSLRLNIWCIHICIYLSIIYNNKYMYICICCIVSSYIIVWSAASAFGGLLNKIRTSKNKIIIIYVRETLFSVILQQLNKLTSISICIFNVRNICNNILYNKSM